MLGKQDVRTDVKTSIIAGVALLVAVIGLMGMSGPVAHAAGTNTANTLKISPVRTDIEVQPGTSKTVQINATNLTKAPISIHPSENDFVSADESGAPALILDDGKYAPSHSLKRFLTPLSDITIPASGSKTINVVITIPKDARPGGYFGAIRLAPTAPDGGGQVNLDASVASLLLVTVPGNVVEQLSLTDFTIQQHNKTGVYFGTPDNIEVMARFQNKGSIQLAPFGKVSVKQGNTVVYESDFNTDAPHDMVLPDGARRWNIPLKQIGNFGKYTVSATFSYGKKNQTIEVTKSFWIIPTIAIVGAIGGFLLLIGLIVGLWFFLRNRRRRASRHQGPTSGLGSLRRRR